MGVSFSFIDTVVDREGRCSKVQRKKLDEGQTKCDLIQFRFKFFPQMGKLLSIFVHQI